MELLLSPPFSFLALIRYVNAAIQGLLSDALTLQPELGTPEECTVYSGRIGGLTAA